MDVNIIDGVLSVAFAVELEPPVELLDEDEAVQLPGEPKAEGHVWPLLQLDAEGQLPELQALYVTLVMHMLVPVAYSLLLW